MINRCHYEDLPDEMMVENLKLKDGDLVSIGYFPDNLVLDLHVTIEKQWQDEVDMLEHRQGRALEGGDDPMV